VVRRDVERMVRMSVLVGFQKIYNILVAFSYALRMQTTTKLTGSPDPFIFYFPIKLIVADHGLHTSSGVHIS
jgi:hypothetical protein